MQEEIQGFVWRGAGFSLPAQVPGCVSDALCAAGIIPPPDVGLNALRGEWAAAREWTLCGCIALPQGRERVFLRARGVHGAGVLLAAGREVGRFAPDDWETEITEFIGAEADSVQIGLRFFARPAEGVPRRALVGVRGGLDAFGVNRLRFEDCYACAAVRDGVCTADFRMTVRPFVPGRYTFRFAAVYGGETLVCREFAEDLRAVRTEIRKTLAVPSPRIWRAAEKNEPVFLRATVLSAGLVCDDHLARTGFRTVETDADARLSVNGEQILLRGARWQCGEPVAWEQQMRRLEALRACGLNCLQTDGLAGDALLSWLDAHGILCVCALPGDETAAAQIVRRAREHPGVVAYCGQSAAVCRAPDGDRPFLRALYAPVGCAALHGNVAALRGDAEGAPFHAAREAAQCAGESTDEGSGAACGDAQSFAAPVSRFMPVEALRGFVEHENREDEFSQPAEKRPCLDILNKNRYGEAITDKMCSGIGTGCSDGKILRERTAETNREELHALQNEAFPHFGNLNRNADPLSAQAEPLNERVYGKATADETARFAPDETRGGIGTECSNAGILRERTVETNREELHALQNEAFPHFGNLNRNAKTLSAQAEPLNENIYENASADETVDFATDKTRGGIGTECSNAGILRERTAETNREELHALQNEAFPHFGNLNRNADPLSAQAEPLYERAENQRQETAFSHPTEPCLRLGIQSSETAPQHQRPEDTPMHKKSTPSEAAFALPAETLSRFGILSSEADALTAPISRYVQAETLRERVEAARMRGENILLAEPFETVESPRSAALFDGERPRPAYFAVESALRPAHVCARMERTGYPCGAAMEAEIWLLYDAKTVPGPLRVSAVLCDGTGRELEHAAFDALPKTGVVGRFRAKMPDVPGALILRVRLDALGEMLDVSDTIVCAALNAPMWPLAHAPYAAVRIENGEIRNACARAAYGVTCGGYLNPAWPGWGALLPGECRAVRDETDAEALNMEPKMK